jgi:glucose-1-phosphate thymidylyltransferase
MKALITAGGRGTRLRPLTHTSNKHLIPVANKPMIHHTIEAVADAGIRDIGISINPETGDDIKAALGTGEGWGVRFTYIVQEAPLGLAHVLRVAEPFLRGERFMFYLGDNLLVGGIRRFVERFEANGAEIPLATRVWLSGIGVEQRYCDLTETMLDELTLPWVSKALACS